MFTGIVTAVGTVTAREDTGDGLRFVLDAAFEGVEIGESIAVNGACLTATDRGPGWFAVDTVRTTLERTTFGALEIGTRVNLERAVRVGDRLGGHWVQGHVDGIATVREVARWDDAVVVDLEVPPAVHALTIDKGSVTVDGVSLTVNRLGAPPVVQVSLIPHTLDHTTLGALAPNDRVHVEGDVLGKYVQRLLERPTKD